MKGSRETIESMPRPTKLQFKPLSLAETAKRLGVPPARARKILALVGVDFDGLGARTVHAKRKVRAGKPSREAKTLAR
jgi:hypothetical protein